MGFNTVKMKNDRFRVCFLVSQIGGLGQVGFSRISCRNGTTTNLSFLSKTAFFLLNKSSKNLPKISSLLYKRYANACKYDNRPLIGKLRARTAATNLPKIFQKSHFYSATIWENEGNMTIGDFMWLKR